MACSCASILMSSVKLNQRLFAVVENDMTLRQNEREVQFKFFCIYLDLHEDIPFFHHSTVTCFQSSNI